MPDIADGAGNDQSSTRHNSSDQLHYLLREIASIQGKLHAMLEAMEARAHINESSEDAAERIKSLRIQAKAILRDYIDSIDREELE